MQIDQLALLFALVIAANLVLLVALGLPRLGRGFGRPPDAFDNYARASIGAAADNESDRNTSRGRALLGSAQIVSAALYQRMTRVVSFMFIGSVLVVVSLTSPVPQTGIYVLLAFGAFLIVLFQDILPAGALGQWRLPIEATTALVFLTILIVMTGGQDSPYFFGYILLVGGAALSTSGVGASALAVICSAAYIVAVILAIGGMPLEPADFGLVAFNLVALSLVAYVCSVIGGEQRRAREEALRLSRFDSLTTLHSRDYFTSELEQEILRATRTGRPFAVTMIDLDGLKAANDRFGHDWGDNLLRAVADVLRGDIRVTDVAARYGGDEFVLVLPETDLTGAILVAEKVRVDISRVALPHNGAVVRTSASIGIVTFPDDGRSSAELLRRADLAMYEAKRRGRDQIVHFARETPATSVGPPAQATREAVAAQLAMQQAALAQPPPAQVASEQPASSQPAMVQPVQPSQPGPAGAAVGAGSVPGASPGRPPWQSSSG